MKTLKVSASYNPAVYRRVQVITIPYTALKRSENTAASEGSASNPFGTRCLTITSIWRELKGITSCRNAPSSAHTNCMRLSCCGSDCYISPA